jgi:putative peptidoglycan lipid II flippase
MKLVSIRKGMNKILRSPTSQVMSLTFVGLAIAWIGDILLAAILGTGQTMDALVVAISLPRLVDTVAREGTRQSLVPLFLERQNVLGTVKYHRFINGVINLALVIGLVLTIVLEVLAPVILNLIAPGLSVAGKTEAVLFFRLAAPMILFAPTIAILSVMLNSQKRFGVVALRNTLAPIFIIIAICLAKYFHQGIAPWTALAYAISSGIFLIMVFFDAREIGYQHQWGVRTSKEDLASLSVAGYWPTLGFTIRQMALIVKTLLLPSLATVGGVSIVYFAQRVASAIQTLVGVSIATTSLPTLTEHELAGNKSQLGSVLRKSLSRSLLITIPIVIGIVLFNQDIITTIYGRGSFEASSVTLTSQVFLWLGLSTILVSLIPIFEAILYAKKAYKRVVFIMIGMAVIEVFLSWLFWQWYGLVGIAISIFVAAIIYVLMIFSLTSKQIFIK